MALRTLMAKKRLDEKQKEIFEFDLAASILNFNAILFAANDFEFRYQLNELVVNYLTKKQEELNNVEVSEETTEQDREFFATMKAIEEAGDKCYIVGNIVAGEKGVELC